MTPQEAIEFVRQRFPFEGYMAQGRGAYLNIADTVMRYLQPGSTILDFGSGACDKTAILQALGFRCYATDDLENRWHKEGGNREKILAFAKEIGIDFKLATDGALPFQGLHFDMVMIHGVLEHFHDSPRDLLNDLLELLKSDGLLFATVPNAVNIRKRIHVLFGKTNLPNFEAYYWFPGPWRGHIREYVKDDLIKLSRYLNLEIIELRSCHHMLEKLCSIARPVYLAVTKVFTGWRDCWLLVAKKKPGWVPRKALPQDELATIIGRHTSYAY